VRRVHESIQPVTEALIERDLHRWDLGALIDLSVYLAGRIEAERRSIFDT